MQERDDNHTCRVIICVSNSACAVLQISAHTIVVSRAESSRNSFSDFLQSSENPLSVTKQQQKQYKNENSITKRRVTFQ